MNWAEILRDKTKYPDDAKFTINGVEVTLGAIRTQNAASQGELEQRLTARQQEQETIARSQSVATDNLVRIVENVQKVTGLSVEDIVAGRIPENLRETVAATTRGTTTAAGVPLSEDPLYAPVMRELGPLKTGLDFVRNGLGQALNVYREDRARLDFIDWNMQHKLPSDVKLTSKQAVDLAVSKGYKNEHGWPDVGRALDELAAPIAAKQTEAEILARGREEGRREALAQSAASMGAPTLGGSSAAGGVEFSAAPDTGGKVLTIREQLDKAFKDPAMLTTAVQ